MECNKIAPHEGRELWMVLAGVKPFAIIDRRKSVEQYKSLQILLENIWLPLYVVYKNDYEVAVTLTENKKLHEQYDLLMSPKAAQVIRSKEDHQRAMGKLFGYTDEEIEAFIKSSINCDCPQCVGVT